MAWQETIRRVTRDASQLLNQQELNNGLGRVDYAALYPKSVPQHTYLLNTLEEQGKPVSETPNGVVFRLDKPVLTNAGKINKVRIMTFVEGIPQIGYLDYWVTNYRQFRAEALKAGQVAVTRNSAGLEMLTTGNEHVNIYFPKTPLGKTLGEKKNT